MVERVEEPVGADLVAALSELQGLLLATPSIQGFLVGLAQLATRVMPGEASCGISARTGTRYSSLADSDALAALLDESQYFHGQGPCLQAGRTGRTVVVDDLAGESRWPDYRSCALARGVRSGASFPLRVEREVSGALNLYAREPGAFTPARLEHLARFADHAAGALALMVRQVRRVELTEQLQAALSSRSQIDQAIGIVMAGRRCGPQEAFAVLRRTSQHANRKLRDVAAEVVRSVAVPAPRQHRADPPAGGAG